VNIVRNRRTVTPNETSSLAGGAINQSGKFIRFATKDGELSRRQVQFSFPTLENIAQGEDGKTLFATIKIPLKNHGASEVDLELEALLQATPGEASSGQKNRIILKPGQALEKTLKVPVGLPGDKTLRLSLRDADGVTGLEFFPIVAKFVPVQLRLLNPFYRNTFFPSQAVTPIRCHIKVGLAPAERKGAVLVTELLDTKGDIIAKTDPQPVAEEQSQTLEIKSLAEGSYTVRTKIEKEGREIAEASVPLYKLPPGKGSEVLVDNKQRIVINGKPWLPSVMMSDSFENIETSGANAVLTNVYKTELLDELQGRKLHAVIALLTGADITNYVIGKTEYDPALRRIIEERVNKVKDHPNLLAWFTFDEPDSFCHPGLSKEIYRHIAELDPYHPIILLNNTIAGIRAFANSADILTPDPYILPQHGGTMLRGFPYFMAFLKACEEVENSTKAYGACVQAFNYAEFGQFNGRSPTFVEQRCQDFLNFILGGKIIYFYKFTLFDDSADLSVGVPAILSEIDQLADVILEGEPDDSLTLSADGVESLVLKKSGQTYVIACNPTPLRVQASFASTGNISELQVLAEERKITFSNGTASDIFEPYATHLYTTDSSMVSPITLREVEAEIRAQGGLYFEEPNDTIQAKK